LLTKDPVPLPSVVKLLAVVGFDEVDQQTPRTVTVAPPSEVTLPPEVAEVCVIFEIEAVVTVGSVVADNVVKTHSLP
jgi:hypothetical protein